MIPGTSFYAVVGDVWGEILCCRKGKIGENKPQVSLRYLSLLVFHAQSLHEHIINADSMVLRSRSTTFMSSVKLLIDALQQRHQADSLIPEPSHAISACQDR